MRGGLPWELLYADDLVLMAKSNNIDLIVGLMQYLDLIVGLYDVMPHHGPHNL